MTIAKGQPVPPVTMKKLGPEGPIDVSTSDLFRGKQVAVFGIPGAYTPVCSASHLPGFVENSVELQSKGCDSIVCVSVNDPWVMDAWGRDHGATDIEMISDPEGEFTRSLGLGLDLAEFGLGERSERYSMIVNDGIVEAINVEASIFDHGITSCPSLLRQLETI